MTTKIISSAIVTLCLLSSAQAQDVPIPRPKPTQEESTRPPSPTKKEDRPKEEALTVEAESPEAFKACLAALRETGAVFKQTEHVDDGNGCGIDKPVLLSEPLPGITLKPEATIRCQTALQLSHWLKESVLPAAKVAYRGDKLIGIENASDYVCRKRNNASKGKISEHARGNALDIGGFVFASGKRLDVVSRAEDSTLVGAFQRAIRATACLYFTTTLGPGSDNAHKTHFHLDILKRNGGYRYCR